DIMSQVRHTLKPEDSVADAVHQFRLAGGEEGRPVFGLLVTDQEQRLTGMLSMYDILLFIRPKHIGIWGEMQDLQTSGVYENLLQRTRDVQVGDLMTRDVLSISPETHILVIIDLMIKRHIRRLPVLEEDSLLGMVYISEVFHHILQDI
ncbi:MAG: CBS domain-containing protein, partial [Desulfohalobiaceae bacterium]